jgi:hypothetical protein
MAGDLITNRVQLGDNATAANNFVWQTNIDGTAKLARGVIGATTQDILTVDASGRVNFPQTLVAFRVYATSSTTALTTTDTRINFDTKTDGSNNAFDLTNSFDLTNDRFQPNVAGYYQFTGCFVTSNGTSQVIASLRKNGNLYSVGMQLPTAQRASVTDLIYLNGTTDYVELFGFSSPGQNTGTGSASTYFSGTLVAKA